MNKYIKLKQNQQEEFNKFPVAFAFSDEQFKEGLVKLGLTENDKDKVIDIGFGGFIKECDKNAYIEMAKKHKEEIKRAIIEDKTGENFIKDMFEAELLNHEYGYTRDLTDTLFALDLTFKEIEENANLKNGLKHALKKYEVRNDYFKVKDFYCRFIEKDNIENKLTDEERKKNKQLNVYIVKDNEKLLKVNTLIMQRNLSVGKAKILVFTNMFDEIGKIKEDGTVEKGSTQQGKVYKNHEKFYKREGICYIPEFTETNDIEEGVTYYDIREEVCQYLKSFNIDMNKIPDEIINNMVADVFECVDWQHTSSLINEDYLLGTVASFPKEYFINNEKDEILLDDEETL